MGCHSGAAEAAEEAYRSEHGRIMAWLVGALGGDFQLAEDSLQEALIAALTTWRQKGIPRNPGAWLATTARRKAIDVLRRRQVYLKKQEILIRELDTESSGELWEEEYLVRDDRLRLIFTCCHPSISFEARVALTLRAVAGLRTSEIASAFLLPEATMAQRLVRCKRKIKAAEIPYQVPSAEELPERLEAVMAVLYLIFNEGYDASDGEQLVRKDLCEEGIRLARLVRKFLPEEPEAAGLLALMLCQHSRVAARIDGAGELVTLEEQDRQLWDQKMAKEGERLLEEALKLRRPGPYQVQAAIASLHCQAKTSAETDWSQIAALYGSLQSMTGNPVVTLNRVVAIAMADGPVLGLKLLQDLDGQKKLRKYRWFQAARADLLRRAGRISEAVVAYEETLRLTTNEVERRYLERRIRELSSECS